MSMMKSSTPLYSLKGASGSLSLCLEVVRKQGPPKNFSRTERLVLISPTTYLGVEDWAKGIPYLRTSPHDEPDLLILKVVGRRSFFISELRCAEYRRCLSSEASLKGINASHLKLHPPCATLYEILNSREIYWFCKVCVESSCFCILFILLSTPTGNRHKANITTQRCGP